MHRLPCLEGYDQLVGHQNRFSGPGISDRVNPMRPHSKGSEATKLQPIAGHEGVRDPVQNGVHHQLDVSLVEVRVLRCDAEDQFGLDHRPGRDPIPTVEARAASASN